MKVKSLENCHVFLFSFFFFVVTKVVTVSVVLVDYSVRSVLLVDKNCCAKDTDFSNLTRASCLSLHLKRQSRFNECESRVASDTCWQLLHGSEFVLIRLSESVKGDRKQGYCYTTDILRFKSIAYAYRGCREFWPTPTDFAFQVNSIDIRTRPNHVPNKQAYSE